MCLVCNRSTSVFFTLGEWMNTSAGLAFAPHVISVEAGEVNSLKNSSQSNGSLLLTI